MCVASDFGIGSMQNLTMCLFPELKKISERPNFMGIVIG
jgi:hypothetical protein